jgi:hypothetical protein
MWTGYHAGAFLPIRTRTRNELRPRPRGVIRANLNLLPEIGPEPQWPPRYRRRRNPWGEKMRLRSFRHHGAVYLAWPELARGIFIQVLSRPGDAFALEVTQDLPSGIVARRTGDAASRMASRTAQIETRDRTSIIRVAQHRTRREDLPQIECSVENIAADEAERSSGEKIWRANTERRKFGA